MSKKHYTAIANGLKAVRVVDRAQWEEDVKAVAYAISLVAPPTYNRMRFLEYVLGE